MKRIVLMFLFILVICFTITGCDKKIEISFETNDSSISISAVELKKDSEFNLDEYTSLMVKEGYVFKGWYSDSSFKTLIKEVPTDSSITLYAKWAKICTVEFVTGDGEQIESQKVEENKICEEPDDPVYEGHEFGGWYTSSDYKTEFDFYSVIKEDTKVYALWYGTYKISFNTTGSSVEDLDFVENNEKPINEKSEKTGYDFIGWYKDSEYKEVITSTKGLKENTTVYAKFEPHKYIINFNRNTGTGSIESLSVQYDTEVSLTKNTITKVGYTFKEWNTSSDGTGTSYNDEETIKNLTSENDKVIDLYAIFTPNKYTICFNKNDGDGTIDSINAVYNEQVKLTKNTITKVGYTFKEWNTLADGTGTSYNDEETIKNLTSENNAIINLYAIFTPNKYTVNFNRNTGTGSIESLSVLYDAEVSLTKNTITKVGYTFKEWNTLADGTGTSYNDEETIKNLASENNAVINLYAIFTPNKYTIVFDGNGKEGSMNSIEYVYGNTELKLTKNAFTSDIDYFQGWALKSDGGVTYIDEEYVSAINVENIEGTTIKLYAVWFDGATISFNTGGGTIVESITQMVGTEISKPDDPTRTGYIFKGWLDNGELIEVFPSVMMNGGKNYVASWEAITYTVKFDSNATGKNGILSGSMSDMEFTYDENKNLNANGFNLTHYTFKEWNTSSDGSGTRYGNSEDVVNLTSNEEITLYAIWEAITYTVKFDSNAASKNGTLTGSMSSIEFTFDESKNITVNAFELTHYTFKEWNTSSDGTGTSYSDGILAQNIETESSTITLYAIWEAITYTINFDSNCESIDETLTGEMNSQEFTYDVNSDINNNLFNLTNYKFLYWNTKADGTGTRYGNSDEIMSIEMDGTSITLYAIWEIKEITIKVQILDESTKGDVLSTTYKVYSGKNKGADDLNVNDIILALNLDSYKGNKDFIGFYLNETKDVELTSGYKYAENSNLEYIVYAYFAPIITIDLSEANLENQTINLDLEGTHNVFSIVPSVPEKEGYIYIWEIDDLSNCHKSTTIKVHYVKNDAYSLLNANVTKTQLGNDSGYKYTLAINSKEYYSYYVKTGKYKFTNLSNVSVLKELSSFDSTNVESDNSYTTLTFGSQTSGYTFIGATKNSTNVIYQFHIDIVASMFSLKGGYQDYSNLNFSQSKYISQERGVYSNSPYTIGSDNIYKLRFNILDNDSVPILSANFNKTYSIYLLGNSSNDATTKLESVSIDNISYQDYQDDAAITYSGIAFFIDENGNKAVDDSEEVLLYVLEPNEDDNDTTYERIKFTGDAVDKRFRIEITQTNVENPQTLTIETYVNYGVNVESHEELSYYYANYRINESNVDPIINLHSRIISKLSSDKLNSDGSPVNFASRFDSSSIYQTGNTVDGFTSDGNVYVRAVQSSEVYNNNLTINGNYFVIDGSELPVCKLTDNGGSQTSSQCGSVNGSFMNSSSVYNGYYVVSVQIAIFAEYLSYMPDSSHISYKQSNNSVSYNNMNIIGNTITPVVDFSDKEEAQLEQVRVSCRNSGGYIGITATSCKCETNNVVIDYATIGITARYDQACAEVNDSYIYYSWANGIYNYSNVSLKLSNSEIRYAGGACVHAEPDIVSGETSTKTVQSYNSTTNTYENVDINILSDLEIDQKTQLVNWVSGSEIWFQLYDMSGAAGLLFEAAQSYTSGSTVNTDSTNMYSVKKSYSKLSESDVAYTTNFEGGLSNDTQLFNFAIMVRENATGNAQSGTLNYHSVLNATFKNSLSTSYDVTITRKPQNSKSFAEYSATETTGVSNPILTAGNIQYNIYGYPVSSYSNYASNPDIVQGFGIPYNSLAQAMGTYSGYNDNKQTLVYAGLATTDGSFYTESAYANGLLTHQVLNHDGSGTGYGWLEFGVSLSSMGLNATVYTYYYQGYDIVSSN